MRIYDKIALRLSVSIARLPRHVYWYLTDTIYPSLIAGEAPNLSPPTSAGVAATCMEASSAQEALENILSEDESDSPPGASDKESVPAAPMLPLDASVVNQPQSFNQNVR